MDSLADQTRGASVVNILPYRLKALKRRRQAVPAVSWARPAPPAAASPRVFAVESGPVRAGIRHTTSGRMTVIQAGLKTVLAMLGARTAARRGLLADERLEAILVDDDRRVFAGFWP
jgi:hypothetical protein